MGDAVELRAVEPERWTIIFHRKARNWFFSAIAMGEFKHVSAFAWVQPIKVWVLYDVAFRRTSITLLPDTAQSRATLAAEITGNCIITMDVRRDAMPIGRIGFFCTSAIKHLIGLRGGALRPDALFRLCVREGGEVSDDGKGASTTAGPDPAAATAGGRG
jgi:hypothetical protein